MNICGIADLGLYSCHCDQGEHMVSWLLRWSEGPDCVEGPGMMYIEKHVQIAHWTREREMIYSVTHVMKIIVSNVEIMYYCHDYESWRSTVNVWWHSCRNWDLICIDFPLQASPMKLECLTIGKLGSFRKSLVKWWKWVSDMVLLHVLCIC